MNHASTTPGLIDALWESRASGPSLILPDGCVDVIERKGELVVVGPMTRARWIRPPGGVQRGARFNPGRVLSWLGTSPKELLDEVVPLRQLRPDLPTHTLDGLLAVAHREARPRPRIAAAIRAIGDDPSISMETLAEELGWGARHLRRQFKLEVGLSPKHFARILRLQRFVKTPPGPLVDIALDCGFADQAHLSREVRALSGQTPSQLIPSLAGRRLG